MRQLAQPHVPPPNEIAPAPSPVPGILGPAPPAGAARPFAPAQIRFMTETDYPPFNYAGPDGHPIGFNVDLARMICEELKITCTMQMRRFDTLVPALNENRGEAVIASIAVTARYAQGDGFHRSLLPRAGALRRRSARSPRRRSQAGTARGQEVAVVGGSAHEAYLKALFTEAQPVAYLTADATRDALRRGEVDYVFGDGIALSFWINGTDSGNCCAFAGGPFFESQLFRRRCRHRRPARATIPCARR